MLNSMAVLIAWNIIRDNTHKNMFHIPSVIHQHTFLTPDYKTNDKLYFSIYF